MDRFIQGKQKKNKTKQNSVRKTKVFQAKIKLTDQGR